MSFSIWPIQRGSRMNHAMRPTGGMDVHGGLRVRLEYQKATRTIAAKYSAEDGVDVKADVERAVTDAECRAGFLRAWLLAHKAQRR